MNIAALHIFALADAGKIRSNGATGKHARISTNEYDLLMKLDGITLSRNIVPNEAKYVIHGLQQAMGNEYYGKLLRELRDKRNTPPLP